MGNPLDPFDNRWFNSDVWKQSEEETRGSMARNLINRHLRVGMTEQQVLALLGPPDEINRGDRHPAGRLVADRFYVYSIGDDAFHGMDDAFLYVQLDKNDRVVKAEVHGF